MITLDEQIAVAKQRLAVDAGEDDMVGALYEQSIQDALEIAIFDVEFVNRMRSEAHSGQMLDKLRAYIANGI